MNTIITVFLFFFAYSAQAASVLKYPKYNGFKPSTKLGADPRYELNGGNLYKNAEQVFKFDPNSPPVPHGVKYQWVWQTAEASQEMTSRLSTQEAQKLSQAITGVAPVSQVGIRQIAGLAIKYSVGGILLSIVAEQGLEYVSGQWKKVIKPPEPDGQTVYKGGQIWWCASDEIWCYATNNVVECNNKGGMYMTGAVNYCRAVVTKRPAVDNDFPPASSYPITDAEIAELIRLGWAIPLEKPPLTVIGDFTALTAAELAILIQQGFFDKTPTTVKLSPPRIDPATGKKFEDRARITAAPKGGVRIDGYKQPVDDAGVPSTNPDGTPIAPTNHTDPCEISPDSVACTTLGHLEGDDPEPIEHTLQFNPGTLPTGGSCPAPRSFTALGHSATFSYQPICDAAQSYVKPVVLLFSSVVATFIFIGGLKS